MPLYEFRCPSGHDFEKFYRSIGSAPSGEKCPECGMPAVRLMSAAGLVFKGSGFYITDYGKDGKKDERTAAAAATKASEAKSDAATKAAGDTSTSVTPAAAPKPSSEAKIPAAAPAPASTPAPSKGKSE